ncbi:hypothetical protein [Cupriavidus sp. TMH.W2]|uniref:hypothetical protein n=1 Tax=Cupriavidus sp. TMH.W2 TaxID=3434465 RepID=UPI003D776CD1
MDLHALYGLWDWLTSDSFLDEGRLGRDFLHIPAGASASSVYGWFESQNPEFIAEKVLQGIRKPIAAFVVISTTESSDGQRVLVHGVRFDRSVAMSLAQQVATDLKAAVEAELRRDTPGVFKPLTVERGEKGYVLMATSSYPYASIEVRTAPASAVVGKAYHSEPLSTFEEARLQLVA